MGRVRCRRVPEQWARPVRAAVSRSRRTHAARNGVARAEVEGQVARAEVLLETRRVRLADVADALRERVADAKYLHGRRRAMSCEESACVL